MHIRCEKIDKSGGAKAENIKYKISLPNSLNIEPLLEKVSMLDGIYLKHNYDSKGIHQISFLENQKFNRFMHFLEMSLVMFLN